MSRKPTDEELRQKINILEKDLGKSRKTGEMLRKNNRVLKAVFDGVDDVLFAKDLNGYFLAINSAASKYLPCSVEEVIGKDSLIFFPAEETKQIMEIEKCIMKTRESASTDMTLTSKGVSRSYRTTESLFQDEHGNMAGFVGICRDITEQKNAEEALQKAHDQLEVRVQERTAELFNANERLRNEIEERKRTEEKLIDSDKRYRDLYDNAPTAYLSIRATDGSILRCNAAALNLFQCDKKSLLRANISEFFSDASEGLSKAQKVFTRLKSGKSIRDVELQMRRVNSSIFWVSLSVDPILGPDGDIIELRSMMLDISKRKKAEEALKERERELEAKTINLEEVNTALRVLLKRREDDKKELEEKVLLNIKQLVMPYLEKLKQGAMDERRKAYTGILESNLDDIVSSFTHSLSSKYFNLTPMEIQVANLIRQGKTSKEIADYFNLSEKTIHNHREHIRKKLGLKNKKANLRTHLQSIR